MIARAHAFLDALEARGPAPDRGRNMDLYAWLVGSWELDVIGYPANAPERRRPGEAGDRLPSFRFFCDQENGKRD